MWMTAVKLAAWSFPRGICKQSARPTRFFAARPAGDDRVATTLNPAMGPAPSVIDHIYADRNAFAPVDAAIVLKVSDAAGHWPSDHFGVWARFALIAPEDTRR